MNAGGHDGKNSHSDILKFDPATNQWEKTGEMINAKESHALAVLPLKEVKPYCLN